MGALLVDQVTAVYIVLAVAFAIYGGVYAYVWRLGVLAGSSAKALGVGFVAMAATWGLFAVLGLVRAVASVDTMLLLAAVAVLASWLLIFYFLWRLDQAFRA